MNYHWEDFAGRDIRERFPAGAAGYEAWQALLRDLFEIGRVPPEAAVEPAQHALQRFLGAAAPASPRPPNANNCIFISHQQRDAHLAMRIACLASQHGLQYWLDVLNPSLALVNQLPTHDPRRSVLIAAIVEIGLLNSSHVIAVHTINSRMSRWVPYEFGRAKAHYLYSAQAAGWFEAGQDETTYGDYVQLAVMCRAGEADLQRWLTRIAQTVSSKGPPGQACMLPGGSTALPTQPPP